MTVGASTLQSRYEFSGEVRPRVESRLGFRVGGKITQRQAEVGQHVKAGQVLAQLDPQDFRLAAERPARSSPRPAPTATSPPPTSSATTSCSDQNFISGADLERRETTLKAAQAQLEQAQAQLASQGNQAGYTDAGRRRRPAWSRRSRPSRARWSPPARRSCASRTTARATWCSRCPRTRSPRAQPAAEVTRARVGRATRRSRARCARSRPAPTRSRAPIRSRSSLDAATAPPLGATVTCCRRSLEHGGHAGDQAADQRAAPGRAGHGGVGARQGDA